MASPDHLVEKSGCKSAPYAIMIHNLSRHMAVLGSGIRLAWYGNQAAVMIKLIVFDLSSNHGHTVRQV
jgi:hypothetical protein